VVPAYRYNPKPSFPKSYLKSKRLKGVLLKTKGALDSKISVQIPYLVLKQRDFKTPKNFAKTNPCLE
jgi:hypothetical protein